MTQKVLIFSADEPYFDEISHLVRTKAPQLYFKHLQTADENRVWHNLLFKGIDLIIVDKAIHAELASDVLHGVITRFPDVPVILVTDEPSSSATFEAVLLGASCVIMRSAPMQQLATVIIGHLAKNRTAIAHHTSDTGDACQPAEIPVSLAH